MIDTTTPTTATTTPPTTTTTTSPLQQQLQQQQQQKLELMEASILEMSPPQLQQMVSKCDAIVSCLGHNGSFSGVWGKPYKLVTDAIQRVCEATIANQKLETATTTKRTTTTTTTPTKVVLLGTVLVPNPNGQEPKRSFFDRCVLTALSYLIPPHVDNEAAAQYLFQHHYPPPLTAKPATPSPALEWCVVRPNLLIDQDTVTDYQLKAQPTGGLFQGNVTSARINVAHSMVQLVTNHQQQWDTWKYQMPVLFDQNN
uniref:NAD(P)-binding domain-containing protein n=1 Tax=Cyclophora tenuis TaxID=216820 RepID=A0A7S1GHY0_CYCTE